MTDSLRIALHFQRSGFSDDEIEDYRRHLEDLGEVTTETYEQPAAGAAFGLEVVLYFIVTAVAGGVVYDALKAVSLRLVRIWHGRKQRKKHPPETSSIQINFADITIILGNDDRGRYSPDEFSLHQRVVEELSGIMQQVAGHLETPPLKGMHFNFLTVPVLAAQETPDQPLIKPHWKLGAERYTRYGYGTYYDSIKRALFEVKDA